MFFDSVPIIEIFLFYLFMKLSCHASVEGKFNNDEIILQTFVIAGWFAQLENPIEKYWLGKVEYTSKAFIDVIFNFRHFI